MSKKDLNTFDRLVKKAASKKPKEVPKKPSKAPSKKQLEEVFVLDKKSLTIKKNQK